MPERWRRELRRLSGLTPSDGLFERARAGSGSLPDPRRPRSGLVAVGAIVAVLVVVGILSWGIFGSGSVRRVGETPTVPSTSAPPTPVAPASSGPATSGATPTGGYWIRFPDHAESDPQDPNGFGARVVATTNLPEGT